MRLMLMAALAAVLCMTGAAAPPPPVILISIDTLRADHVGSFGSRGPSTPNIDSLSKGGTLFTQANAQAPLTLPSHVSMLTSSQPFTHGITDNGLVLGQSSITLAEVLKQRGYSTAAFVGGFVLDRRFGLNQGFDHYDSPFETAEGREMESGSLKRLGVDVVNSALAWIGKNGSQPFFVFLHLFDLHAPDNLPPDIRKRFPGPRYKAELAYVDELMGEFFQALRKQGIFDRALIVFTSDHGEGLGDHGENSHGFFIYQSTLSVPLIFHWPAVSKEFVSSVDEPVSLLGIAPTILEVADIAAPPAFQGKSLLPLAQGKKSSALEEVYAVSSYGRNHFNTSALSSMRKGRFKYIQAPRPEFYDLQTDPGELKNLWSTRPPLARAYADRLAVMRRSATKSPAPNQPGADVLARLRSLGYLGSSSGATGPPESGPDPKDRIADYETYRRAVTLTGANRLAEANQMLRAVLAKDGKLTEARILLGLNLQKGGQHAAAARELEQVLRAAPADVAAHYYLANSYLQMKEQVKAVKELQAALISAADRTREWKAITIPAEELLARLLLESKDFVAARRHYEHLLSVDNGNYEGHFNLAWLDAREQRLNEAIEHLQAAIQARPKDPASHNALGGLYLRTSRLTEAETELTEATRLDPKSPWAFYNLGLLAQRRGDKQKASGYFTQAVKAQPDFKPAQDALARLR